ncbi:MAG: dTDP-4-dehydrorhamnose reductase [Bacilli bacterium]|nr:dTDP-4-dehydrorhamnose reductase [Bacilli bacterium]
MKVLVTGVNGQLGYELAKELNNKGYTDILAVDKDEMDITNKDMVNKVIKNYHPDVIFHCAAWTAVDKAEDEKEACYNVNVNGTKYISEAAKEIDAKLIYISTDYVFDGTKEGLYEIDDEVNPKSIYGETKYEGEQLVRQNVLKHFIVRISWVFGINGNNFIKTMLKLAETRNELTVVADQFGSPTYTVDLAKLLVEMSETEKYGTYHINNEGYCNWAEFAEYIFKINNKNVNVKHITSEEYPQKAYRPRNSKLSKKSLDENGFDRLPSWQDAVERYSKELKKVK